ncbi:hypothetical protein NQ317_016758 [Molorchus minor]|uniref:Uncharacterized protein n=1 Tax=Molorchus minor TaxID=1323400 RepID=A0ABQ9JMG3_9CUCU|nr:hypothetical protein NQ317_016758 [Molorchus minor]
MTVQKRFTNDHKVGWNAQKGSSNKRSTVGWNTACILFIINFADNFKRFYTYGVKISVKLAQAKSH